MAVLTAWWRTRTLDSSEEAIGYMPLELLEGWLMSAVADMRFNQLYEYDVTSTFVRD